MADENESLSDPAVLQRGVGAVALAAGQVDCGLMILAAEEGACP
jgi:hypothetical protein